MNTDLIPALHVRGHNPNYKDPRYLSVPSTSIKKLRWWQVDAFEKIKDSRFALVVAFCGSGKSILQVALSIHDIVASKWSQKQLILVPQQHISGGFIGDDERAYLTVELEGKVYDWKVINNFCDDVNVMVNLKAWLLTSGKEMGKRRKNKTLITDQVAICSHQALGRLWKTLTVSEKKEAIKNLTLRVDEAHHVNGVYDMEEDTYSSTQKEIIDEDRTNLGDICAFILNSKNTDSKIHMTTATPYRGDQDIILSPKAKSKFDTYFLDWIEHFNTLGIEDFDLQYEEYKVDPIKSIVKRIKSEQNEKHMVVIPSSGSKWRLNGKAELDALLKAIYKVVPKERVLDLVTQATQDANKAKLLKEPKASDNGKSKFDVIVTCMLGREGTDWCPCSRLHNTANESSITLAVQTIGRPFRRFEGKGSVKIINYLPAFVAPKKGMSKRDLLADRTNALLVCMQMDEMCKPIFIPKIKAQDKRDGVHVAASTQERMSLTEVFGSDYQSFKEDLIEKVESIENKDTGKLNDVISELLDDYGVSENVENVKDGVRALVLRMLAVNLKVVEPCIDAKFVRDNGFDRLVEKYVSKDASIFFGRYSKDDWKVIREILRSTWEENYEAWKLRYGKKES